MTLTEDLQKEVDETRAVMKTAHPFNQQFLVGRISGLAFAIKKAEEAKNP
jgi:hypothetical protein